MKQLRTLILASTIATAIAAPFASATDYYWDGNGTSAGWGFAGTGASASIDGNFWTTATNGTTATGALLPVAFTDQTSANTDKAFFKSGGGNSGTITAPASATTYYLNALDIQLGHTFSGANLALSFVGTSPSINYSGTSLCTLGYALSGNVAITNSGSGTLYLSGANSNLTGTVTLNSGALQINSTGLASSLAVTLSGGTFRSSSNAQRSIANNLSFGNSGVVTLGASLNGGIKTTGTVDLGSTQPKIGVAQPANIQVPPTTSSEFAGKVSGSDGFEKVGGGTLTLSSFLNDYTGTTKLTAGTLLVNGTIVSDATVASGATFGGNGTAAAVAVSAGGIVAPGATGSSSVGTLTTGAFSLGSTSVLKFELSIPDVVGGTTNDLLSVTALTLDGTLQVTEKTGFGIGTYRLFDYTGNFADSTLDLEPAFLAAHPGSYVDTTTPGQVNLIVQSIPEPNIAAVLLGGMTMIAGLRRRRS